MKVKFIGRVIIFTTISIFTAFSGIAQVKVHHVIGNADLTDKQGIYYALPRTLIKVDITVQKTEFYAGPYAPYAAKYLDMTNVSANDYNEYDITEVRLSTVSEPDPNHYYFAEFNEKDIKKGTSMLFSLSRSGLAMGLDGSADKDKITENISKLFDKDNAYNNMFGYSAESNLIEKEDTIIRKVVVDTVTVEKKYLDKKWVEKSTEQKAVEAANMVAKIRENRFHLITGYQEVAFDAGTMAYMDKQLRILEDEYLSLFIGITIKKTLHYTFTVYPDPDLDYTNIPVFVFSERHGIKDVYASGGEKINLSVKVSDPLSGVIAANDSRTKSYKGSKGFAYRIPVTATVSLNFNNDLKVSETFQIAQLGSVTFLPPSISSVQFYPETGGIKNMIIK